MFAWSSLSQAAVKAVVASTRLGSASSHSAHDGHKPGHSPAPARDTHPAEKSTQEAAAAAAAAAPEEMP